jgi:hypothetical protein
MKRLLVVVGLLVAISARGQRGVDAPKMTPRGNPATAPTVTIVVGPDAASRQLAMPDNITHLQVFLTDDGRAVSDTQAGCPVHILSASFERPVELMLASDPGGHHSPSLRLGYGNFSGKDIESAVLTGWLKVKDSPYQLDSMPYPFHLELSRKVLLAVEVDQTEVLKLAKNVVGMDRVELSQVIFIDGSTWKPERQKCTYRASGENLRVAQ